MTQAHARPSIAAPRATDTQAAGLRAEARALAHLQAHGLTLLASHYRTPGRGGGEIDLVMREPDGTVVFVEVRQRSASTHGGAAASVGTVKQRRLILAARHWIARLRTPPPCRFDVVAIEGSGPLAPLTWLRAAFDAS